MTTTRPSLPVVVGIDGSAAAITAALWAVDEAVDRDIPLRLVHVVPAADSDNSFASETEHALMSLCAADAAVRATGKPVKVETAVVRGRTRVGLLRESREAAMMRVGAVGTEPAADRAVSREADLGRLRRHGTRRRAAVAPEVEPAE